jgi:hypothetical protein
MQFIAPIYYEKSNIIDNNFRKKIIAQRIKILIFKNESEKEFLLKESSYYVSDWLFAIIFCENYYR